MTLLLLGFWPGLAGAFLLGLMVGGIAGWPARPALPLALCAATAVLAAVALAGLVPGMPGLWLDGAALLVPPYLAGCAVGACIHHLAVRG